MKYFLLVGRTEGLQNLCLRIRREHTGVCLLASSLFHALDILYGKKIDILIVSSKCYEEDEINFIGYIAGIFPNIRIFIAMDNGLSAATHLPENVTVLTDNATTELLAAV